MFLGSGSLRKQRLGPVVTLGDLTEFYPYDDEIFVAKASGKLIKRFVSKMIKLALDDDIVSEFYQVSYGSEFVWSKSENKLIKAELDGEKIKDDKKYTIGIQMYHLENLDYQVSYGSEFVWSKSENKLIKAELDGEKIKDDKKYTIGIQMYHLENLEKNLGIKKKDFESESENKLIKAELDGEKIKDDKKYTIGIQMYHLENLEKNLGIKKKDFESEFRCTATSGFQVVEEYLASHTHLDSVVEGRIKIKE